MKITTNLEHITPPTEPFWIDR